MSQPAAGSEALPARDVARSFGAASVSYDAAASLQAQVREELLSRLRGLDLSLGTLSAAGMRWLLALRPHLGNLEWLNVAGNRLTPEALAELRAAWPACEILDGDQLVEVEDEDDE